MTKSGSERDRESHGRPEGPWPAGTSTGHLECDYPQIDPVTGRRFDDINDARRIGVAEENSTQDNHRTTG